MNQSTNTTASIDLAQLDRLEALALAATPGEWRMCVGTGATEIRGEPVGDQSNPRVCRVLRADPNEHPNAEFIVAANPATMLQLIALARRSLTSGSPADELQAAAERLQAAAYGFNASKFVLGSKEHHAAAHEYQAAQDNMIRIAIAAEVSAGAAAKTEQAALKECAVCDGRGCTHYPDGEWEGKCDSCEGTGIDQSRATAAAAGSAQPRDVCAEMRALCSSCGGTGDVHSFDGDWRGECNCPAGIALALDRLKIAAAKTQRENEELRAALARAPLPAQVARNFETDASHRLRMHATNANLGQDLIDALNAGANECDRFYLGMMAWKRTAEAKDATSAQPVDDARDAACWRAWSEWWRNSGPGEGQLPPEVTTLMDSLDLDAAMLEYAAMRANDSAADGGAK